MSFDEVYKAYYQELRRFGRHLNISPENTSDLIQETYLRFYLELKKKVVINNPRAWLYKVLLNLFRTMVNSEKRELRIKEELATGKAGLYDLLDEYHNAEKQQIVLKILGRMPDRDKEILLLYNNGFSYNEMAEILEINPNSIGQTIVRAILIILASGLSAGTCSAQKLLDIYKNGPVKLIPEKKYGEKNKWESLFNLYYDSINFTEQEGDKKIIVAPDGSVFMSHKNRHEIWKFGPDGTFVKKFGSRGGKAYQFPMLPSIEPVVDGKYIFTTDANARLKFFDLDGNYFKSITLDYMAFNFQPVGNGQILLEGNVMWKYQEPGTRYFYYKWRHIIVNLDIYTGKEKIIYDFFRDPEFKFLNTTNRDSFQIVPIATPGNKIYLSTPQIMLREPVFTLLSDGQFIHSNRETGQVKVFDKTGKEKNNFILDISPLAVTDKDVQENYEKIKQRLLRSIEQTKTNRTISETRKQLIISQNEEVLQNIYRYKGLDNYFPHLPFFSNIILDDEGNFLVFEFTNKEEKNSNIFNVIAYISKGEKLASTSFLCDDYDLSFSENTFVISTGYVFAVAKLKNTSGMPLRLVKLKITN